MSEDLIKRSDAVEVVYKALKTPPLEGVLTDTMLWAIALVRDIPSADRLQGEWLPFEFGDERWHKCSCCGTADKYIEYVPRPNGTVGKLVSIRNFCPNCGARMKGADDEQVL